ncbi:NAD-dependent epimerase/dehydratase family protein, partial [Blautia wexlerae]|nr:NAD-dependent epimerase/dehydratase family protein [Blautia wexlerae]
MKRILVLGGTRFFGKHMVSALLAQGHSVAIANRGQTPDPFGGTVERIVLERTDADCICEALSGKSFDVVCDSLAYTSNDVRALLDSYHPSRYVMTSSTVVYQPLTLHTTEADFDPLQIPLKWCARGDDSYAACKQQAEAALRQIYPSVPAVAVRFPFVIGEDDYTRR